MIYLTGRYNFLVEFMLSLHGSGRRRIFVASALECCSRVHVKLRGHVVVRVGWCP